MHDLDSTVRATDAHINRLVGALLFDAETLASAARQGVTDPVMLYAGGRAGAMGDVTADVVRATFAFFEPSAADEVWPTVLAHGRPVEIALVYGRALADGARARWDGAAAPVVAEIGWRLADAVDPMGCPLFAGWCALPRADDALGAAAGALAALRELRGDVHVQCVAAEGLSPLEAEIVSRGPAGAALHGWKEPYPDPAPLAARVAAAESETNRRMVRHYECLTAAERDAFAAAVAALDPPA